MAPPGGEPNRYPYGSISERKDFMKKVLDLDGKTFHEEKMLLYKHLEDTRGTREAHEIKMAQFRLKLSEDFNDDRQKLENTAFVFSKKLQDDLNRLTIDSHEQRKKSAELEIEANIKAYDKLLERAKELKAQAKTPEDFIVAEKEVELVERLLPLLQLTNAQVKKLKGYSEKDIGGGIIEGFKQVTEQLKDEYTTWKDATRDTMLEMKSTMSDVFFDSMIGELKSASDYWKAFQNTVKRIIANIAAQWVTQQAAMGIASIAGMIFAHEGGLQTKKQTMHTGGMAIKKMHSGGMKNDELLRVLKSGEYVIKDRSVKSIGAQNLDYMNRTGQMPSGGGGVTNIYKIRAHIEAIDVKSLSNKPSKRKARELYLKYQSTP